MLQETMAGDSYFDRLKNVMRVFDCRLKKDYDSVTQQS